MPNGFDKEKVADVPAPTALDFTPNGRMLVTSKPGRLYVFDGGQRYEALDLADPNGDGDEADSRVCSNSERGLLGVALDPDFGTTGHNYVYLYYTFKKFDGCPSGDPSNPNDPVNRVSRFTMSGNTLNPGSELVLLNNILSPTGSHNGGDLKFGKDKNLYVSIGDGGCDYAEATKCQYENDASRDRNVLLGKVLRITRDGGIPTSNPYTGTDSDRCNQTGRTVAGNNCKETFALGFRNPFRLAFDPDATGTSFRINDVGGGSWEEIDRGEAGADYGWNLCEGRHDNPYRTGSVDCTSSTYTGPIHEYGHSSGCGSITGGAFVPDGFWPASYDDSYLFGDYVCHKIFELRPKSGGGFTQVEFASDVGDGGPIAMDFGPYKTADRALYYTTFANGGEVRRIFHTAGNLAPVATADTAGPNYGSSLTMDFDGSASRDPDGDTPLKYVWDFGDGSPQIETSNPTISHTYRVSGKFTVNLTVKDSLGKASAPDAIEVYPGDTPPRPTIVSPAAGTTFRVGQSFTATGSVADTEDDGDGNAATAPTLGWEVRRYHDGNHYHPWSDDATFVGPPPEDLFSTDPSKNYLQVRLTATDSLGLSTTVIRRLEPKTVDVGFETQPPNLKLGVNGYTFRAPELLTSWEGYALNVAAWRQSDVQGQLWAFDHWSDGGAREHTIKTPASPKTYTAYFRRL